MTVRLAIVGFGKIARDQHLPAIAAVPAFQLVAVASPHGGPPGLPWFETIEALLASDVAVDAVALCMPPQARFAAALAAIAAGKSVFLEKPPAATLSEVEALAEAARARGVTLLAGWHSRFAAAVAPARAWLADRRIASVRIDWKEDVRVWHPGQRWIWQAGGLGVFDPGVNALSILTAILPDPVRLTAARLAFPSNCATPIAAELALASGAAPIVAEFDFLQTGQQTWTIAVETDAGSLRLFDGGARLAIDGRPQTLAETGEYPALYRHFADLIARRASDVDVAPLRLVADAFLCGERTVAAPFEDR